MKTCSTKSDESHEKNLVLYGGAYLNKGGTAIAYGTLKVLKELNINFNYMIDPEPFPSEFFLSYNLTPIYRYSDVLTKRPMPSISPIYTFEPFIKCLINSYNPQIRQLRGNTIWHIGDSPFSDKRSSLSIIGQVIALSSLKKAVGGKAIIGGISLGYPRTKIGIRVLRDFFKSIDHIFIRGLETCETLKRLDVPSNKMTQICDFAYHLDMKSSSRSNKYSSLVKSTGSQAIALILRDYAEGQVRIDYIHSIKGLVSKLNEIGYRIFFIPTSYAYLIPENDLIFLEKVLNISDSEILDIRDLTPEEIIHVFSNFSFIISTRLHGAVYGTLANVPTIHLYEERKSLEVIRDIFGETIPLINLSDFSKAGGVNRIISLLEILEKERNVITSRIKYSIERARRESLTILNDSIEVEKLLD